MNYTMKGKDGRNYLIEIKEVGSYNNFEIIDEQTHKVVDDGWFVISKNGTLRLERVK